MLANVPSWVFAVFFLLLLLGYRQSRPRVVAPGSLAVLASAMCCLSLYGVVAAFGIEAVPVALWSTGVVVSVALGEKAFGPRDMAGAPGSASVRVPGSWLPLGLMMGIFVAKFALGFAAGVGSGVVRQLWFVATSSLVLGLLSGGFAARALAVRRFAGRRDGAGHDDAGPGLGELAGLVPGRLER